MKKKSLVALLVCAVAVVVVGVLSYFAIVKPANPPVLVGLQVVDGGQYYYDEAGAMQTGWQIIEGKRYFFDPATGKAVQGWYTDEEGNTYYFGPQGYALTGNQQIGGKAYTFDEEGRLVVDVEKANFTWQIKNGVYYCIDAQGNYVTGLQEIGGVLYYFDVNGARQTGWHTIEGHKYYFSTLDGRGAKGWFAQDGARYYFGEDGYALTGKQTIDGVSYVFDDEGRLVENSQNPGGNTPTRPAQSSSSQAEVPVTPADPTPPAVQEPATSDTSSSSASSSAPPASSSSSSSATPPSSSSSSQPAGEPGGKPAIIVDVTYEFKTLSSGRVVLENDKGNRVTGLCQRGTEIYYFDDDGYMLTGKQTLGHWTYFFMPDGAAIRGWHEDGSSTYYLDPTDAFAVTSLQSIEGDLYYFDEKGSMETGWQQLGNNLYCFDAANGGAAVKGWLETATPHTTPNAAEAFVAPMSARVRMADNISAEGADPNTGDDDDSDTGGEPQDVVKYYFGDNGFALKGLITLESGTFYFDDNYMMQTGWHDIGGRLYCFDDESGAALSGFVPLPEGAGTCYLLPGKGYAATGIETIDGALYYFSNTGVQKTGWVNSEGAQYYFSPENGAAVKNTMVTNEVTGSTFYFGDDGVAVTGIRDVDGALYYFNAEGIRQTGWQRVGDALYYFDPATGAAQTGWKDWGNAIYYLGSEYKALSGIQTIDGGIYGFAADGSLQRGWFVTDTGRYYLSPDDGKAFIGERQIGGETYYFRENGTAVTGFVAAGGKFYLYSSSGAAQYGWYTDAKGAVYNFDKAAGGAARVGWYEESGAKYYFNTTKATMVANTTLELDKITYLFDKNGRLVTNEFDEYTLNKTENGTYYVSPGGEVVSGLHMIEGELYYFSANTAKDAYGRMLTGLLVLDEKTYYFDPEKGAAVKGFKTIKVGEEQVSTTYYFDKTGRFALTGLQTIDDTRYYFNNAGVMQTGWHTLGEGASANTYYFGEDGKAPKGVFTTGDSVYYFSRNGYLLTGWQTVNELRCYFDPATGVRAAGLREIEGRLYYFNTTDGAMVTNGWVTTEQVYYMGADGCAVNGLQTIGNGTYYFIDSVVQTGWHQAGGNLYYFIPAAEGDRPLGTAFVGWFTAPDTENRYYFRTDGSAVTGVYRENDYEYWFNSEGVLERTVEPVKTTWAVEDGQYYYYDADGNKVTGLQTIDGALYYFDGNGVRQSGWVVLEETHRYYFGEDGRSLEGWQKLEGATYYFGAAGFALMGEQEIDGTTYAFFDDGRLDEDSTPPETLPETPTPIGDGWKTNDAGGKLYILDGKAVTGWNTVSGARYYFDAEGVMQTGWCLVDERWYYLHPTSGVQQVGWRTRADEAGVSHQYYYTTDGALLEAGWNTKVGGVMRYVLADGAVAQGWLTLDNARYYFDAYGIPTTDWNLINGQWYEFDAAGKQYTGWRSRIIDAKTTHWHYYYTDGTTPAPGWSDNISNVRRYVNTDGSMAFGWVTVDGSRYYCAQYGVPYTGWQQVSARWYVFGSGGQQLTGWQTRKVSTGDVRYYYNANGTLPSAGWFALGSAKHYVLADGQMAQGWLTISGKTYYFNTDGQYKTGTHTIGGKTCIFDNNGVYVAPPVINAVNISQTPASTRTITVNATANAALTNKALSYSFNSGATWSTGNTYTAAAGATIAANTIRVKDSLGNITTYGAALTIPSYNPVQKGIDVSAHQGYIDWAQVKASGVEFAVIRGLCWSRTANYYAIDSYFDYNVRNAKANGIKVGVYLYSYAFNKNEMAEEVLFFMNSTEVQNLMREGIYFDLPVFIDYEDPLITKNTANMGIAERTDIVRYGMQIIEQRSNYKFVGGFYTYYNFARNMIDGAALQREGYPFWLARFDTSAHGWSPSPSIWQYTSKGTVPGIATNVDLNYGYQNFGNINGGAVPPPVASHNLTVTDQNGKKVTGAASSILAQIVQAEVGGFGATPELYKAQAIAAQSWILYQQSQGITAPQVALATPSAAVQTAVNTVVNKRLTYNGAAAFTPYYAYSNGTTNSGSYWGNSLPYLQSVSSPYDKEKTAFTGYISEGDLRSRINEIYGAGTAEKYPKSEWIQITSINAAGYVTGVRVCGHNPTVDYFYQTFLRYNGGSRYVYPIASPSFKVSYNGASLWTFTSTGYGHGVGMSQYGAYRQAQNGWTYEQILAHYYPGTKVTG